jgi:ubiquinone/menaquinone biosynthesis C-methylase UbiE
LPTELPANTTVFGIGLNEEELKRNAAYTGWKVYDLNANETEQWTWLDSESMDVVICSVSIEYLIYPVASLKECRRILKQGMFLPSQLMIKADLFISPFQVAVSRQRQSPYGRDQANNEDSKFCTWLKVGKWVNGKEIGE